MPLSVTQLNGANGFKVAVAGTSVTLSGDFNHDGFDDLVIGDWTADPAGRSEAGQTYVLFGRSGFSATIAESAITGSIGFVIRGVAPGDSSGWSVAYTDINGDGIDDLAIGAPFVNVGAATHAGSVYVVYGTATPPAASFELAALNGANGFVLTGDTVNNSARAGYAVSAGGDFNQDGRADLLIGSPFPGSMFGSEHSHAYVLYGAASFAAAVPLASVTGTAGITYNGGFQDQMGRDLANIGDVNGDGRPDILITQFYEASVGIPDQPTVGRLIFGPPGAAVDPTFGWQISEEGPTNDVSGAGDFNGDGIDDFIVALHRDEAFAYGRTASDGVRINGAAVIVYGRTGGWEGASNGVNSSHGFVVLSPDTSYTVASAGDFNGDGIDDIIVSAGTAAYVVFGSNVVRADLDLRNMTATEGLIITDVGTFSTVAGAGDVNHDGYDDVAIASSLGTFVIFGGASGSSSGTSGDDTLTGTSGDDNLSGLGGNDHLLGLGGNDTLDGGTGADTMEGGIGNDTYFVDNASDVVIEAAGEGSDTVRASVSYTLPAGSHVELLQALPMSGTDPINLFGNEFDNFVDGNEGANYLRGGNGNDFLFGWGGNDILNGDAGADIMIGSVGDDTYYVDNAQDVVLENGGEGTDRVAATVSYVLTAGSSVELLEAGTLSSTAAMDLTGNAAGQIVAGNNGVNILRGEGGSDTLYGYGGNDYLIGGGDSDFLIGGLGDDTYYIDSDGGDVITELAGEGNDRVATLVSYTLGANASIEVLEATNSTSTNAMDLTGNDIGNVVAGNNGVNVLRGGGGNDTIGGYGGNDTLYGEAGDDTLIGGLGNDTMSGGDGSDKYYVTEVGDIIIEPVANGVDVAASSVSYTLAEGVDIEVLEPITFNAADPLNFTGNEFGQTINGNNGANTLNGGLGADVMEGLGGQDFFAFTTALGNGNIDRINDFLTSFDRILLEDSIFTGLTPGGLFASQFVVGSQAADADDRIIYNSATGAILFDVDGTGAVGAVQFATIGTGLNLTASDFLVI